MLLAASEAKVELPTTGDCEGEFELVEDDSVGSISRSSMTSYGVPAAFEARNLDIRVNFDVILGALMDKSEPDRVAQGTGGSVTTDNKVSAGSFM